MIVFNSDKEKIMLEKKDLENIEFGYNGAISIIEGVNPLIQMQYSLYFNAVLKKKANFITYKKTLVKKVTVLQSFHLITFQKS